MRLFFLLGEWPDEMDCLLGSENVIRVSLAGRNWDSQNKITPTKAARWILELVNDLNLETFSILAAAGAGTVALACAQLKTRDRLQSVGIIAGTFHFLNSRVACGFKDDMLFPMGIICTSLNLLSSKQQNITCFSKHENPQWCNQGT